MTSVGKQSFLADTEKPKERKYKEGIVEMEPPKKPTKYIKLFGGKVVGFTFSNDTQDKITEERLKELAFEHKGAGNIHILDIGFNETKSSNIIPVQYFSIISIPTCTFPIYKTVFNQYVYADDKFITSCAKGQKIVLQKDITVKVSATADGNELARLGIEFNNELVCRIKKGSILTGPTEDVEYNSREFRCTFYQNEGIWERWGILSGMPYYFWGNFTEPTRYELYAIDRVVK